MTTILTYPDNIVPDSIDWRISFITQAFVSPFGAATQTAEVPGARWAAKMNFSNLQQEELRQLSSFFIRLRGMSGRFTLYDMSLPTPQSGTKDETAVVSTTLSPTKTRIELASVAGLTEGDYLECTPTPDSVAYVNSYKELKMITEINNNIVSVEPPFRVTPSTGDVVSFNKASCTMMLDTDNQVGWSSSGTIYLSNFTVSCMEAF